MPVAIIILIHCFEPTNIIMCVRNKVNIDQTRYSAVTCVIPTSIAIFSLTLTLIIIYVDLIKIRIKNHLPSKAGKLHNFFSF